MPAPAAAGANQRTASSPSAPTSKGKDQPATALNAPKALTATPARVGESRPSARLQAHVNTNHNNTPGKAIDELTANKPDQAAGVVETNIAPTATSACTNSSARSTTPTWHTSNSAADGARIAGAPSNTVLPNTLPCVSTARAATNSGAERLSGSRRDSGLGVGIWAVLWE